jgi:cytoskeletal protein RodZ
MFEIGASLREARTRRGLSREDVQRAIRIRDRYLAALEDENWDLLPGEAYTKGFLRTYAEFLGLDGALYVDEFNRRFATHEEQPFMPEALSPIATRSVGFLRPLIAIAAIVAVVAAVAAWQLGGSSSPPAKRSTEGSLGAATTNPATTRSRTHTHITGHLTPPASKPHVGPAHAVLTASRGPVWLLVRSGSATGTLVYQGVLAQGQTLPLTLSTRMWVRVGAPWNLDITLAGRAVAGLPTQVGDVYLARAGLKQAP